VIGEKDGELTHNRFCLPLTPVCHYRALRKYLLLLLVAPSIINQDLDLLHNKKHSCLILVVVAITRLAEQVVHVAALPIVIAIDDKNLVNDFLDNADVTVVVLLDNEVLFLHLDDGVLIAEVANAVDEVEDVIVVVVVIVLPVVVVVAFRDERGTPSGVGGEFSNNSGSKDWGRN
jgi:hypothetical protein